MKTLSRFSFFAFATSLFLAAGNSQAVDTCGGQKSIGNPMPCCSNGGNCTWWTWKKAKEAGWLAIPTGNANTWDNTALLSPAYKVSTTPSVGAVAVKESAPYKCGTSTCDTGHVAWVTGIGKDSQGNITGINTSQMACGGSYGVTYPLRAAGYFNKYVTKVNLNGKLASLCPDGKVVASSSNTAGNTLQVVYSTLCKTTWAKIVPKIATASVSVSIRRTSDNLTLSSTGAGTKTSPMVETGPIVACANGKVSGVALPQVCK